MILRKEFYTQVNMGKHLKIKTLYSNINVIKSITFMKIIKKFA